MTDEIILSTAEACGLLNDCLDVETMSVCILAFTKFMVGVELFKEREEDLIRKKKELQEITAETAVEEEKLKSKDLTYTKTAFNKIAKNSEEKKDENKDVGLHDYKPKLKEPLKVSNTKKIDEPVFEIDDELKKIYLISNYT